MTLNQAIVQRIYDLCDERNLTYTRLCTLSGVSQSTIGNIVNRKVTSPTVATIKRLCDGLGITLSEFFESELFVHVSDNNQ